jgi:hypothetical protein
MRLPVASLILATAVGTGCGGDDGVGGSDATSTTVSSTTVTTTGDTDEQRYPDVIDVEATASDDGTWSLAVTISSPYDTPERYADGWRVLGPDGEVYGEHRLTHDHAGEQPFTRTQRGVEIPPDVDHVTVEGRDQVYGYGGAAVVITLER